MFNIHDLFFNISLDYTMTISIGFLRYMIYSLLSIVWIFSVEIILWGLLYRDFYFCSILGTWVSLLIFLDPQVIIGFTILSHGDVFGYSEVPHGLESPNIYIYGFVRAFRGKP